MLHRGRWLALLAAWLLLTGTLAAATELEGFDEVEEEPSVVQDPVKAVRSRAIGLASLGRKWDAWPLPCALQPHQTGDPDTLLSLSLSGGTRAVSCA